MVFMKRVVMVLEEEVVFERKMMEGGIAFSSLIVGLYPLHLAKQKIKYPTPLKGVNNPNP